MTIKTNNQLTELYSQAEDYFFKNISKKFFDLDDDAALYMTGVPVDDLNIVYIKKYPSALNDVLSHAKQFYDQDGLGFVVIIPEEFCSNGVNDVFKSVEYFQTNKTMAMLFDLQNTINTIDFADEITIKASDNNLDDWMEPLIAFSATAGELIRKYADTHRLAQSREAKFYHFSLYKQGKPISSLTLSLHNNIARIDDVATLPEFQGKGYATRLMNYILLEAKKHGAAYCFLEASEPGLSLYQKLGFKPLYTNITYARK